MTRGSLLRLGRVLVCVGVTVLTTNACAPAKPPVLPSAVVWRQPDVPRDLAGRSVDVAAYSSAWSRIRAGDLRTGERTLAGLWASSTSFYPAAASLGELQLHARRYREAGDLFAKAIGVNARYVPALVGMVDARLGAADDAGALTALQALLAVDPNRSDARGRLDVVRLRVSQTELAEAEKLRGAGQWDAAEMHLTRALAATPENGVALRTLAQVLLARGVLETAEARARQATTVDPGDAMSFAVLGDILERREKISDAVAAYASAVALDPRPAFKSQLASLQERAASTSLPENYRAIASTARVTRAQVAAALGIRLHALLARAPARVTTVVTDVRSNWAAAWILPVVRAGWVEAMPNHTFQPAVVVTRADLARIVVGVLTDVAEQRRSKVDDMGSPRGTFADVPRDHAAYRAVSLAVSVGIMPVDGTNRFQPAVAVTGAELLEVISRLESQAK